MASSPPAIIGAEPTWVPYEPTRDCSQGLCSLYCPQWCYFIFPPPPPFDLAGPGPDDSSGHVFSPLVIAIIGVLATAFLLVSYYTFISKYCGTFGSLRRRFFGSNTGGGSRGGGGSGSGGSGHGQSRSQESWNVLPASGLDETLINKITVCKYRRGDAFVHITDCSVCLGEFHDGESLRLLPKCSHAFHQQCIDTWLKSHSNCPLCRSNITFVAVEVVPPEPEGCAPGDNDRNTHEVVVVMDELENMCEEQQDAVSSGGVRADRDDQEPEDSREGTEEEDANGTAEIREEGVPPPTTGSTLHRDSRMSIADVLQSTMEDELIAARESGLLAGGAGTSRRCRGENSSNGRGRNRRASQDAVSDSVPPVKRLPPGGRSCFSSKSGRGVVDSDNPVRGGQS